MNETMPDPDVVLDEMIDLGRKVHEGWRPGFETDYPGRVPAYPPPWESVVSNVEMFAVELFLKSDFEVFRRRVDDWCERFDQWVEENLHNGDKHGVDNPTATQRENGPSASQDDHS